MALIRADPGAQGGHPRRPATTPSSTRGRKAFVFTSIASILVLVLIIFATSEARTLERTQTQTARIATMDAYLRNLEQDLPRVTYIATFRGLIALEEHVSATTTYLPSIDEPFTEVFVNGTVNGQPYVIMEDSTFAEFATRFADLAARQGMLSAITVTNLTAVHDSPWSVKVTVTVAMSLTDTAGTATIARTRTVTTSVPITDIKDPLYSIGTLGRSPNPVRRSNVTAPYITPSGNPSRLLTLLNSSAYIADTDAPSFLMRFTGDTNASAYGIQSLVNLEVLRAQGFTPDPCRSIVDFKYFTASTAPNRLVNNTDPQTFWLADSDLADYDATAHVVGTAPAVGC